MKSSFDMVGSIYYLCYMDLLLLFSPTGLHCFCFFFGVFVGFGSSAELLVLSAGAGLGISTERIACLAFDLFRSRIYLHHRCSLTNQ